MSASEKLKALATSSRYGLDPHELAAVLPQIVAVVEAAEAMTPTASYEIVGPYEYVRGDDLYAARTALAALEEALS
jgi:hypothetical protein